MTDDVFVPDSVPDFDEEQGSFEPDRRQVITGLAAGIVAGSAPAQAEEGSKPLDVRIIRNPTRHNEFGVGIQLTVPANKLVAGSVEDKIAVALYPRTFQDLRPLVRRSFPRGERIGSNGKLEEAVENLDRFSFPHVQCRANGAGSPTYKQVRKEKSVRAGNTQNGAVRRLISK